MRKQIDLEGPTRIVFGSVKADHPIADVIAIYNGMMWASHNNIKSEDLNDYRDLEDLDDLVDMEDVSSSAQSSATIVGHRKSVQTTVTRRGTRRMRNDQNVS